MCASNATIEKLLRIAFERGYKQGRSGTQEGVMIDPTILSEYRINDLIKIYLEDSTDADVDH